MSSQAVNNLDLAEMVDELIGKLESETELVNQATLSDTALAGASDAPPAAAEPADEPAAEEAPAEPDAADLIDDLIDEAVDELIETPEASAAEPTAASEPEAPTAEPTAEPEPAAAASEPDPVNAADAAPDLADVVDDLDDQVEAMVESAVDALADDLEDVGKAALEDLTASAADELIDGEFETPEGERSDAAAVAPAEDAHAAATLAPEPAASQTAPEPRGLPPFPIADKPGVLATAARVALIVLKPLAAPAAMLLLAVNKPLDKKPDKTRDTIGWIAVYTAFLALCVFAFVLVFRKPGMPVATAAPPALVQEPVDGAP